MNFSIAVSSRELHRLCLIPQFLVIYKLVTLKEFQHEIAGVDLLK
nr:MAG TPA: hypothetical protein [Caudoviricetes sp.]